MFHLEALPFTFYNYVSVLKIVSVDYLLGKMPHFFTPSNTSVCADVYSVDFADEIMIFILLPACLNSCYIHITIAVTVCQKK